MAKKSRLGTDPLSWIGDTRGKKSKQVKHSKREVGPRIETEPAKSTERGLPPGWTRATVIMRKEHLKKLKALAYWTPGGTIKDLVDNALANYLRGKKIKPIRRSE